MKIYSPLTIVIRLLAYSLLLVGAAEMVRLDALFPMEEGYFGEISFTEISQEIILFVLGILYFLAGYRYREIQPVTTILSLIFLASFIREFNFIIDWWIYPVLPVLLAVVWLLVREWGKLRQATAAFFSFPASAWLSAGFLLTYVFSRLMGRSSFWRLLYQESNYRLAKAGVEEGLELAGDVIMLISVIELFIVVGYVKRKEVQ